MDDSMPPENVTSTFAEYEESEEGSVHPSWYYWIQQNANPKTYYYPRPRRELTPWQKRGPMTRRDWVKFYQWAAKNALPRPIYVPPPPPPEPEVPGKKKRKPKPIPFETVLADAEKLAEPKKPREKFEIPPTPSYPYSPKISWKDPPHHDPGRPFRPPCVPKCFQHIDLEIEFWSTLRFKVLPSTARYMPSANVLRLAQPRVIPTPENLHCPIPEKPIEEPPPRKRMTYRQWREHLRRLEYLAKPVSRPYYYPY